MDETETVWNLNEKSAMKTITSLVVALTAVCVGAALALSVVNLLTLDRIEEQEKIARMKAIRSVLPPSFDNDPVQDTKKIVIGEDKKGNPDSLEVYLGKKGDHVTGLAFSRAGEGYGGFISVMMGIDAEGKVSGIYILPGHFETPGLGANIEKDSFTETFKGKSLGNSQLVAGNLAVDKDGGDIEAIAGATISPRGVARAVSTGLHIFKKYRAVLIESSSIHEEPAEEEREIQ